MNSTERSEKKMHYNYLDFPVCVLVHQGNDFENLY